MAASGRRDFADIVNTQLRAVRCLFPGLGEPGTHKVGVEAMHMAIACLSKAEVSHGKSKRCLQPGRQTCTVGKCQNCLPFQCSWAC